MAGERQSVPARHGIATFVPKGHSIKIINTYGSQVIDTWAFALHKPPNAESDAEEKAEEEAINKAQQEAEQEVNEQQKHAETPAEAIAAKQEEVSSVKPAAPTKAEPDANDEAPDPPEETPEWPAPTTAKPTIENVDGKKVRTWASYVPSVPEGKESEVNKAKGKEEAKEDKKAQEKTEDKEEDKVQEADSGEKTPTEAEDEGSKVAGTETPSDKTEDDYADAKSVQSSKSWGSYLPNIRSRAKAAYGMTSKPSTDTKNSKSWLSYLPSGTSFTSYLPSKEEALSAFAASHHRDPNKSYAEQLYEFSKTPVGAASLSAATGSGTAGSLYAAYTAYTKLQATRRTTEPMEYLSLPHTIDALQRLFPEPGDTLLSNLHTPVLTVVDDTTPPTTANADPTAIPLRHGTILPACDPTTYRELAEAGEKGEEHGSCAENLVLALQEFNKSTGLKGARTVGADVTINSVPVPLSLFMNATVNPGSGKVVVKEPRLFEGGKRGRPGEKGGFVKFRAERDVVVVMSACPMDFGPTNGGRCMAANFVVEEPSEEEKERLKEEEREEKAKQEKEEREKGEEDAKTEKKEVKSGGTEAKEKRRDSGQGVTEGTAKPTKGAVEQKTKDSDSGAQTPKTEGSGTSSETIKNAPKPGRKKPKKLDRRSSSRATTPQV
ncbi:hypothetical protein GTA08_BOTSDO04215 [Neofusicoccum parvum]|nr:hypothetical protein GTA08_BOTSDO04215 [Neofusicoccum parvum]